MANRNTKGVFFFAVEERIAVQVDHAVCDSAMTKTFANCFCNTHDYHCGENVCQCAGDLEHDDHDANRDVHDATESRRCAEEGVGAWCDTSSIWIAGREES